MAKRKRDRIVDSRKRHNENLGQGSSMQPASESLPRNLEQPNSMQATTTHVQNIVEQSVTEEKNVFGVERQNKNQRGPTLMSWIWELEKGRYLSVGLDRDGMPIGVEGGHLFQFMGSMVRMRNLAPINYKRYPDMPQRLKDAMWDIILSKFKFIPFLNETTEVMLKKEIGEKWRTWKSELKRKWYDASLTPAQMWAELKDDRVDKVQFIALANFWCSPEGQALSDRNQKNCKKLQEPHCTGTKTLARLRHEMAIAAGGIYPGRAEMYIASRTKKKGEPVNQKAAAVMAELQKYIQVPVNSESTSNNTGPTNWEEDAFAKVKGKEIKSRVRCLGKNICTNKKSSSSSSAYHNGLRDAGIVINRVIDMLKRKFPDENMSDLVQQASTLGQQIPNSESTSRASSSRGSGSRASGGLCIPVAPSGSPPNEQYSPESSYRPALPLDEDINGFSC